MKFRLLLKYVDVPIALSLLVGIFSLTLSANAWAGNGVTINDGSEEVYMITVGGEPVALQHDKVHIVEVNEGEGEAVRRKDTVEVRLAGRIVGGDKEFIRTKEGKTTRYGLTNEKVMKGMREGVVGMKPGGKRILYLHPVLGLGSKTQAGVPGNSPLEIEVELVNVLPDIRTTLIHRGSGWPAEGGEYVLVHYTGRLEDGTVFDSSRERDQPFRFALGSNRVIEGWNRGVTGMRPGERRRIVVPPYLGYGDKERPKIPAGSTLDFDVEVISTSPGVTYKTTKDGTGDREVQLGDNVRVHLRIWTVEGDELINTQFSGARDVLIDYGLSVPGLIWGVIGMRVDEVREVEIPAQWGESSKKHFNKSLKATIDLVKILD